MEVTERTFIRDRNVMMEPEFYTPEELAAMIGRSVKFVEKHRHHIAGSMKIGKSGVFSVI